MDAISAPGFKVHFVSDTISLKIPEFDVCLQNGWTITPLNTPYGQSVPSALLLFFYSFCSRLKIIAIMPQYFVKVSYLLMLQFL